MNICVRRRAWCLEVADAAQRGQTPKGECRSQRYFTFKVDQVYLFTVTKGECRSQRYFTIKVDLVYNDL